MSMGRMARGTHCKQLKVSLYIVADMPDTECRGMDRMANSSPRLAQSFVLFICLLGSHVSAEAPLDAPALLKKMEAAYAKVKDYRTRVEIKTFNNDGISETEKFLYTFKEPNLIRIDFESPHAGMIVVYPDKNGKVVVQPAGIAHLLKLHLAPDNRLLTGSSGQRIDQTDIGLLINNVAHSLTDQRRGPIAITQEKHSVQVRVLAVNHFHPEILTLYRFFVDEKDWLPSAVEEFTPDGTLQRSISFIGLTINNGTPDSFFQLNGAANQKGLAR
jgi:outer membrane lipoprotein-sorting protein